MNGDERTEAYRSTRLAAGVVFVIACAAVPLGVMTYGWWPQGVGDSFHALLALTIGIVTHRSRGRWSPRLYDALLVLLAVPYLMTVWWPQVAEARAGTLTEPLVTNHFVLLGLAILSPRSLRLAFVMIGVFTLQSVLLWHVLETTSGRALPREPWLTLFFAGISAGLSWSRWRRHDLESRFAHVASRANALTKINRILLALRDRANTPLQTLEVGLTLMEDRPADSPRVLQLMRRAVAQLSSLRAPVARTLSDEMAADRATLSVDLDRELAELQGWAPLDRKS
ncbi:MAG: hypothetical protein SFX73_30420 [Kofleriaceae bacterium]|nr:hypothetical protein [Kofleriaceae bacterium]